jgi:hypothetical protein
VDVHRLGTSHTFVDVYYHVLGVHTALFVFKTVISLLLLITLVLLLLLLLTPLFYVEQMVKAIKVFEEQS